MAYHCYHGDQKSTNQQPVTEAHVTHHRPRPLDGRAVVRVGMPRTPEVRHRSADRQSRDVIAQSPVGIRVAISNRPPEVFADKRY